MSAQAELLQEVFTAQGIVASDRLAQTLHITKTELAAATGLSRDAISKRARSESRATQARLNVPRASIVERSEMRAVYVVAPDGRVSLRQVRLGRVTGDRVEILAGLVAGERIALEPAAAGLEARAPVPAHD